MEKPDINGLTGLQNKYNIQALEDYDRYQITWFLIPRGARQLA